MRPDCAHTPGHLDGFRVLYVVCVANGVIQVVIETAETGSLCAQTAGFGPHGSTTGRSVQDQGASRLGAAGCCCVAQAPPGLC